MDEETIEARLQQVVGSLLPGSETPLAPDLDLFEEGLDSIAFMQLIILLETEFSFKFVPADLQRKDFATLGLLTQLVNQKLAEK